MSLVDISNIHCDRRRNSPAGKYHTVNCDNDDVCFLKTGTNGAFNFGVVATKIAKLNKKHKTKHKRELSRMKTSSDIGL